MADTHQEWRPNNRPQSTVARNFSAALDELFRIDGGIEDVNTNVDKKTHAVATQTRELEALEQRLKETEARLKRASSHSPRPTGLNRKASDRHTPVKPTFDHDGTSPTSPLAKQNGEGHPGMQKNEKGEYVMVDRPLGDRGRAVTKDASEQ